MVLNLSTTLGIVQNATKTKERVAKGEINMKKGLRFLSLGVLLALVLTMGLSAQPSTACEPPDCCDAPGVRSPGYWMNHPEAWPVEEVCIGAVGPWNSTGDILECFTKDEAIDAMMMPVAGDKTYTLFPALVAAKLNFLRGNGDCDCVVNPDIGALQFRLLGEAQDWFSNYALGSGVTADSFAWQFSHGEKIYWRLDAFNNGEEYWEDGVFWFQCAPEEDY
jgi:hypothetical protein